MTVPTTTAAELAAATARTAASQGGLQIRDLRTRIEIDVACALFASIWGTTSETNAVTAQTTSRLLDLGGYLAGAYDGSALVGACAGFLGRHGSRLHLHSHILGVLPEVRRRNTGFALKQHQRAWALSRGIAEIEWTFDPLVGRNASFNVHKLGARPAVYIPRFYGPMNDGVNQGDDGDRLLAVWDLASDRAVAAAGGTLPTPSLAELRADGATVLLDIDDRSYPVIASDLTVDRPRLCRVPDDIVSLRSTNPAAASMWRGALRGTLGRSLTTGWSITGVADGCWYVLTR